MKCYKCGSFLYDGEFCSTCGADVRVYRKIVLKSNDFYNSGLEFARDRNLSKAAEHLRLSLKLYKGNVNAHNLLGLVYFETGEYTRGFAHWVISKNIQPDNNLASVFLDQLQDDKAYFDGLNDNIKKYNKAVDYVEQGSYDLAEIQLKKLINDSSAHMVNAYLLSALLRIRKKKYAAARKILMRAQAIDAGNPEAIAYMTFVNSQIRDEEKDLTASELRAKHKQERSEDDTRTALSGDDVIIPKPSYKEHNPTTMAVIQILIGFLVGAALMFFVVIPAKTNSVREEVTLEQAQMESQIAQLQSENAELSAAANAAQEAQRQLEAQAAAQAEGAAVEADAQAGASAESTSKDETLLLSAHDAYESGNVEAAANTLSEIEHPENFTGANKILYDTLAPSMEALPDLWYKQAMQQFEQDHFKEALELFTKVYEKENTTGESLYYMGLCNYDMDKNDEAKKWFNEYLQTFPEGPHVVECEYLIGQME